MRRFDKFDPCARYIVQFGSVEQRLDRYEFGFYSALANFGPAPKFGHFWRFSEYFFWKSPKITKLRSNKKFWTHCTPWSCEQRADRSWGYRNTISSLVTCFACQTMWVASVFWIFVVVDHNCIAWLSGQ